MGVFTRSLKSGLSAVVLGAALLCGAGPASAEPTGGSIPNGGGSGSIIQLPGSTIINQSSDKLIINWNSFGISANELVKFVQPSQLATVLNRVTGLDPSVIMGSLQANGRVFLVNPNGIFFGSSARVDVGSLMASTLDIKDEDFLRGIYKFAQDRNKPGAYVVNRGLIQAKDGGFVVLAAPLVSNEGVLVVNLGRVTLAGTSNGAVSLDSQGLVNYVLPNGSDPAADVVIPQEILSQVVQQAVESAGVVQGGVVVQEGDRVRLVGAGGLAVNAGSIQANGPTGAVTVNGAQATVLAPGSTISATGGAGQHGGQVVLAGDRVLLNGNASVDVSGAAGGGTVLIGGDRGAAGDVPVSRVTYLAPDAQVHADATMYGDGGKVVVWGSDVSATYGLITARGGGVGGDGGFVETSGRGNLQVTRLPDVTAPNGHGGEWLLDPQSIIISTADFNVFWDPNAAYGAPFDGTQGPATLDVTLIETALNSGISVTIETLVQAPGTNNPATAGDITVLANIDKTGGSDATLTLNADRSISVEGTISSTSNKLNVGLNANRGQITIASNVTTNGGNFTANSASGYTQSANLNTGGGDFSNTGTAYNLTGNTTTGGGNFTSVGTAFTASGNINTAGGDVQIGTAAAPRAGAVALNGNVNAGSGSILISTDNGGTSQGDGTSLLAEGLRLLNVNGGDFLLTQTGNDVNVLAADTESEVRYRDLDAVTVGTVTVGGSTSGITSSDHLVNLRADGTITVAQVIDAGTNAATLRATTGNIVSTAPGSVNADTVNLRADFGTIGTGPGDRLATSANTLNVNDGANGAGASSIWIIEANAVTLNNVRAPNTVDITAGGTITVAGGVDKQLQGTDVVLHATSGNITGTGTVVGATLSVTADSGSVGSPGGALNTSVDTLQNSSANGGSQGIFITNNKALTVSSTSASGANGTVKLTTTAGGLTLTNGAITTSGSSGTVNLTAATGITDDTSTSITGNALTATAGTGSVGSAGNALNTQLNTLTSVTVNSNDQGVFLTNNQGLGVTSATATGTNGTVKLTTTAGGLTLADNAIVTPGATGTVQLSAATDISDGAGKSITANTLTATAGTGNVGANGNPLNTSINTLTSAAANSNGRGVFLSNDKDLAVTSATATGTGGTVQLTTTSGGLTLANGAVQTDGASGNVQLTAATGITDGASTSITGNTLTASAGSGSVGSAGNVLNSHVNTLSSVTANTAGQGVFLSNDQSLTVASVTATGANGAVQLTTTAGGITLQNNAIVTPAATGSVQLTAATSIVDSTGTSITANTLTATATTGSIGTNGNALNTSLNTLVSAAANTAGQGVFLSNDKDLAVTSATATGANGTVQLTTTAGSLTLADNAVVTADATGTVELLAAVNIIDGAGVSISGNLLTIDATAGTIGANGNPLDTNVSIIDGTGNGLVNVNNTGFLTVNQLVSTTGSVTLTNDDGITVVAPTLAADAATMSGSFITITETGTSTAGITVNGPSGTADDPTIAATSNVTINNAGTGNGSGITINGVAPPATSLATVTAPTVNVSTTGASGTPHDITLGGHAVNASSDVTMSARGSIVDGATTSVTAGNGTFTAVGGNVGQNAGNPLNTSLNTLVSGAANSNDKGVFISNDRDLFVQSATATGTNGTIELTTTSGSLTLADGALVANSTTGTVKLTAADGISDVSGATSITANALTATAGTGSIGLDGSPLNTSLNTLTLAQANTDGEGVFISNNKDLSVTSATSTGVNGTVQLTTTSGGITLADNAIQTSATTGDVELFAAAGITDGTATSITGDTLVATATTGSIGSSGNVLDTSLNTLVAVSANSDNQGVFITNDQDLAVTSTDATGANGTVQIKTTSGSITLADSAIDTSTTTGTVIVEAAADLTDNTATSITGNTLTAKAGSGSVGDSGNVLNTSVNTLQDVQANTAGEGVFITNDKALAVTRAWSTGANGTVQLTTTAGSITLANASIVTDPTTGVVRLTAADSITDSDGQSITGNELFLTANSGTIGTAGDILSTQVHVLDGTANGLINMVNTAPLTVNNLTSTTDSVTLVNTNSIDVTALTLPGDGPTISGTVVSLTETGGPTGGITVHGPSGTADDPTIRGTVSVSITNLSNGSGSGITIEGVAPPATSVATVSAPSVTVSTTGSGTTHDVTLGDDAISATNATLSARGTIVDGTGISVTANNGTFTAVGGNVGQSAGNPLNTSLNTLVSAAANSDGKGVFLTNDKDLVVTSATATGANGIVRLTTTAGAITLLDGAIVTSGDTGTVNLTAATDIVDGTLTSITGSSLIASAGTGSIGLDGNALDTMVDTLTAVSANTDNEGVFVSNGQDLTVASATATGVNGTVQLTTTAGGLTLQDGSVVTPGASGTVQLTAAAGVQDGSGTSITANTLEATAGSGSLGSAGNALDTRINTLTSAAANSAGQGVFLTNNQSLAVSSATATGTNGIVQLTTTASGLTLQDGSVVTDGGSGTVVLTAATDITDGTLTSITGNTLTATAVTGSVGASGNPLNTAINTLTASASSPGQGVFLTNSQDLTVNSVSVGPGGTVQINTTGGGDLTLGNGALSSPGGTVQLHVSGSLIDGTGTSITADTLQVTSDSGSIGVGGNPLNTQVHDLTATADADNQRINVSNSGALTLSDVSAAGDGGSVTVVNDSSMTANRVVAGNASSPGSVTLVANGGDLTLTSVTAEGGTVDLSATAGSILDGFGMSLTAYTANLFALDAIGAADNALQTTVDLLNAAAINGSIDLVETDSITLNSVRAADDVTVTALTGDIAVRSVTAGDLAALTATQGAITNLGNTVNANTAILSAGTYIGTYLDPLQTNVNNLDATASRGIHINEKTGLAIGTITNSTSGSVQVVANGGDMVVGTVTNPGGGVTLQTTSGSILDNGESNLDLVANGNSSLVSSGTIGTPTDALEVSVTNGVLTVQVDSKVDGASAFLSGLDPNRLQVLGSPPGLVYLDGMYRGGNDIESYDAALSNLNPFLAFETMRTVTAQSFLQFTYPPYYTTVVANPLAAPNAIDVNTLAEVDETAPALDAQTVQQLESLQQSPAETFVDRAVELLIQHGWSPDDARTAAQDILAAAPENTPEHQAQRVAKLRALLTTPPSKP